jgi:hypothetical protein
LWESVSPVTPFYVPPLTMLAMLPIMWTKFKLPADAGEGVQASVVTAAEAPADAGSARS